MVPVSQSVPGEIEGIWVYYPRGNLALISLSTWCCLAGQGMHAHGYPVRLPPLTNGDPLFLTKRTFLIGRLFQDLVGTESTFGWNPAPRPASKQLPISQEHILATAISLLPCVLLAMAGHILSISSFPLLLKEESRQGSW